MSIREIEVRYVWRTHCRDCDYCVEADSAGEAEGLARHHINEDIGDENPRPHYDHTVAVEPQTIIGR